MKRFAMLLALVLGLSFFASSASAGGYYRFGAGTGKLQISR